MTESSCMMKGDEKLNHLVFFYAFWNHFAVICTLLSRFACSIGYVLADVKRWYSKYKCKSREPLPLNNQMLKKKTTKTGNNF